MKKKNQAAENYLTAQTKRAQEQIEFMETHGKLFETIMSSHKKQKKNYRFIIEVFQQLAVQLSKFYPDTASLKENVEQVHEWGALPLIKNIKQDMTQEQMKAVCKSIYERSRSDNPNVLPEYVIIEFDKGYFTWDDGLIDLNHAVVEIEIATVDPLERRSDCFDLRFGARMNATIYIHERGGRAQAFLKATGDDGNDYYFELSHFAMLFLQLDEPEDENEELDRTNGDTGHIEDTAPEDSSEGRDVGMFTLFSRSNDLLFTTRY